MLVDIEKLLEDMRSITMLTGEISSVHFLNLKNWVFIAFDNVNTVEIDYDLSKAKYTSPEGGGSGFINFKITTKDPDYEQQDTKTRSETLTQWVRSMFWKDINIHIFINNQCVFEDTITPEATPEDLREV
jgi:hypothetical protein